MVETTRTFPIAWNFPFVDESRLLTPTAVRSLQRVGLLVDNSIGRTLTAGSGLTGGGDLSADRTFDVGAGLGITVNADSVQLNTSHPRNVDHSTVSITAGNGLTGGGTIEATRSLAVGAGDGIEVTADAVALAAIANNTILANVSGGTLAPSALSVGTWDITHASVITASSGTFTTVSANCRFLKIGKLIFYRIAITITTNGTAAGVVIATLPFNAVEASIGNGRAHTVSGLMLQSATSAATANLLIRNYDGTYPGADGEVLIVSGFYEQE